MSLDNGTVSYLRDKRIPHWNLKPSGEMIMRMLGLAIIFFIFIQLTLGQSLGADLTGTWESKYQFGPIEEVMTANIQQSGENILGSFSVQPSSGDEYSGIIFGTVNGDMVKANYLSVSKEGTDSKLTLTFIESRLVDQNTLRGTYYVQDSDMNSLSGPFQAIRK